MSAKQYLLTILDSAHHVQVGIYQGKYWSRKIQSAKPEFSCSLNHFISSATIDDHGGTSGSVTLHFIKLREGLYQIR